MVDVADHCFTFRVQGHQNAPLFRVQGHRKTGDVYMTAADRAALPLNSGTTRFLVATFLRASAANVAVTDLCSKGMFHVRSNISTSCRDVSLFSLLLR
jgi:hypothetical protein